MLGALGTAGDVVPEACKQIGVLVHDAGERMDQDPYAWVYVRKLVVYIAAGAAVRVLDRSEVVAVIVGKERATAAWIDHDCKPLERAVSKRERVPEGIGDAEEAARR